MNLSPREALARRKLLTRCRGILLDNNICKPSDFLALAPDQQAAIPGIGPKAIDLIYEVINQEQETDEWHTLFPYPDGIDNTRFGLTAPLTAVPPTTDARLERAFDVIDTLLVLIGALTATGQYAPPPTERPFSSAGTC